MDYHAIVEWDKPEEETMAKNAMEILCGAYPGHPWHVNVKSGVLVIKHMRISQKWGMALHYNKVGGDWVLLKRGVMVSGGELLERAGLLRGHSDGSPVLGVDGMPAKDRVIA